jgi:plastocyanin
MRRLGIFSLALGAALAASAVAVGAGAEVRIHRLHLPPPPTVAAGDGAIPVAGEQPVATVPPVVTQPEPPPVTTPPVAPPPTAPAFSCTASGGGATADATGTMVDEAITLAPATVASAATLRFRGINNGVETHNLSLRDASGTKLCGTPNLTNGQAETFVVMGLPPGTYTIYCTIHPVAMRVPLTVS